MPFFNDYYFRSLRDHLGFTDVQMIDAYQRWQMELVPQRPWTEEEQRVVQFLHKLPTKPGHKEHVSAAKIGKILNRTSQFVYKYLVTLRPPPTPPIHPAQKIQSKGAQWLERMIQVYLRGFPYQKEYVVDPRFKLRLDFFVPELRLGLEYDGPQHDQFIEHFHKNHYGFQLAQRQDKRKEILCERRKITLVRFRHDETLTSQVFYERVAHAKGWKMTWKERSGS